MNRRGDCSSPINPRNTGIVGSRLALRATRAHTSRQSLPRSCKCSFIARAHFFFVLVRVRSHVCKCVPKRVRPRCRRQCRSVTSLESLAGSRRGVRRRWVLGTDVHPAQLAAAAIEQLAQVDPDQRSQRQSGGFGQRGRAPTRPEKRKTRRCQRLVLAPAAQEYP